jgi:hypothetical protein
MNWLEDTARHDAATPAPSVNGSSYGGSAETRALDAVPAPIDLAQRRDELAHRVAELQWDLGGLVYEMAIRDHIRLEVIVQRAAMLQEVDAELAEVDRILKAEQTGAAGTCGHCGALHSRGAVYCWQCGQSLVTQVPGDAISRS